MIGPTINSSNISVISKKDTVPNNYEIWIWTAMTLLIAIVIVLGNSLVLYAARTTKMNTSRLRFFDKMIKILALNDLLVGLIVIPFRFIEACYLGKNLYSS